MKIPIGIRDIWIECKDGTDYFSRLEGDKLVILTYQRKKLQTNENDNQPVRAQRGDKFKPN